MQPQQAKQTQQALAQTHSAQPNGSPQPWAKPTFEQVPLNEALADTSAPGNTDFDSYAS